MKIKLKSKQEFKELLLRKGFTQRGLGRKVGIAESYASQIANGERNPGPQTAKLICEVLDKKFDDIFFVEKSCKSEQINEPIIITG